MVDKPEVSKKELDSVLRRLASLEDAVARIEVNIERLMKAMYDK